MNALAIQIYTLGLRITQARIIQQHFEKVSYQAGMDYSRMALYRLDKSLGHCATQLDIATFRECNELLQIALKRLPQISLDPYTTNDDSCLKPLAFLEGLCLTCLESNEIDQSSRKYWFRLGLVLARGWYRPPPHKIVQDDDPPVDDPPVRRRGRRGSPWVFPDEHKELLATVQTTLQELFPIEDSPTDMAFCNSLPEFEFTPTWSNLEAGLVRLIEPRPTQPVTRRNYQRDHALLRIYEDLKSQDRTYKSVCDIWNSRNPNIQPLQPETARKAITKAKVERNAR